MRGRTIVRYEEWTVPTVSPDQVANTLIELNRRLEIIATLDVSFHFSHFTVTSKPRKIWRHLNA